jgi:hypothetical protein
MADLERFAEAAARSGIFGFKNKEQAIALMGMAQAEGKHPCQIMIEYHIMYDGKVALKADAMLARFQAAGGKVAWKTLTDEKVTGVFSHPAGGEVEITWDIDRAKKAEVYKEKTSNGATGMWVKYPRQMLKARVTSEGIRLIYPVVLGGMYTPEEVSDFSIPEIKDTTAVVLSTTTSTPPAPANDAQEAPPSPVAAPPAQSDEAEATTLPAEASESQEPEKRALKATKKQIEETAALCKTLEASGSLDLQQFREWRRAKYGAEKTADCTREQAKEVFAALVAIRDNGVKGLPF